MDDRMIRLKVIESTPFDEKRGIMAFVENGEFAFKKCCKKYKRGKRCKKCPNQ